MGDFAKILYEKFFMRDLLGKIGPGFVATFAVLVALDVDATTIVSEKTLWLLWVVAIPTLYIAGLSLQILGEQLGLHSASPKPRYFLLFFSTTGNWAKANEDHDKRLVLTRNAPPYKWGDGAKQQLERFIYLKEGSGNFALALLVVLLSLFFDPTDLSTAIIIVLVIVILALFSSHVIHAKRQARFEILSLKQNELLKEDEANDMLTRV